jgi:hypothetical protein
VHAYAGAGLVLIHSNTQIVWDQSLLYLSILSKHLTSLVEFSGC